MDGVIRTRVGYAGGKTDSPNYKRMGDHTEVVQVDYDPHQITYAQLLHIFWMGHNPFSRPYSEQYKNAVFFHTKDQEQQALISRQKLSQKTKKNVQTQIVPLNSFTMAENYHQKNLLKTHELKKEMLRIYPLQKDLVDSTAVSRINGYIGGYGTKEQLVQEIETLGLSSNGQKILLKLFERSNF